MDHFPSVLARQCRAALSAGLILAFSCNAALSAENCQQLEALANQYAGVELTVIRSSSSAKWLARTRRIACTARLAEPRTA